MEMPDAEGFLPAETPRPAPAQGVPLEPVRDDENLVVAFGHGWQYPATNSRATDVPLEGVMKCLD